MIRRFFRRLGARWHRWRCRRLAARIKESSKVLAELSDAARRLVNVIGIHSARNPEHEPVFHKAAVSYVNLENLVSGLRRRYCYHARRAAALAS